MADPDHLAMFLRAAKSGSAQEWNGWRASHPEVEPDLSEASMHGVVGIIAPVGVVPSHRIPELPRIYLPGINLRDANLIGGYFNGIVLDHADLRGAFVSDADLSSSLLRHADLSNANAFRTDFSGSDLSFSNLESAMLNQARLVGAVVQNTVLSNAEVFGLSAWALEGEPKAQQDLVITAPWQKGARLTVDDIRIAQFVHLLLEHPRVRDVITTIGQKGVLILGRFTDGRKNVLDALRDALRERNFVPMVFDFERPAGRDFTETILTLAGLSAFVIADITAPRSTPMELQAVAPNFAVPVVPILQEGEASFALLSDLQHKFDWVLPELIYDDLSGLIGALDRGIIAPALAKHDELVARRVRFTQPRFARDY